MTFWNITTKEAMQKAHMIKSKFGDAVRSKTWTAQVNEALCKVVCHNIVCLIHEMHELGIEANKFTIDRLD